MDVLDVNWKAVTEYFKKYLALKTSGAGCSEQV